ncbi:peptidylprolyl isomerase [Asticcacaulis sp. LKC15W]|uniref:Peptidyl-prolyl cis-trans isomerase n=2 Tax=Asticcacaulis machinosus TaxID=2984211 RepID=A0ABT5HFQ1_9CAUL|nr:peptidylprolyl isomerase [Asticcacaulis machinosus]MDC7675089.1 peptidylprolyl isomerase [Asticcacaulis machinosus]
MSVLKFKSAVLGLTAAVVALAPVSAAVAQSQSLAASEWRDLNAENTLVIDTSKGRVVVEMYPELAPQHVERMKTLTRQGFYNGLKFHRVIEGFMAQTGDPQGTGEGGSTLPNVPGEFTIRHGADFPMVTASRPRGSQIGYLGAMPVQSQVQELIPIAKDGKVHAWGLYCAGVLGMARAGDNNSANSQFFLMRSYNAALEKRYTAFGMTVQGLDVVRKLKLGEPALDPDTMTKVQIMADIPEADRPKVKVMNTGSKAFADLIEKTRKEKGADFSACDITVPTKAE